MGLMRGLILSGLAALLAACVNTITIVPDVTKIERSSPSAARIPLNVGYFIPEASIAAPHVDENNLRYFPYRDIELGYQKMLSNVFSSATKLFSMKDQASMATGHLDLIIVPEISTRSGGSDFMTWPPSSFVVNLTSNIKDAAGKPVATPIVAGMGSANSGERLKITGIAGSRAMEDALLKMQSALLSINYGDGTAGAAQSSSAAIPAKTFSERLIRLNELKDNGLITQKEYDDKRKEILDEL